MNCIQFSARQILRLYCFTLVASLCSLTALPVSAEMLLATIGFPGHYYDPGIQLPAHMSFGAHDREPFPGQEFAFINQYTPDEVGTVYEAPSALVAQMSPIFSDPTSHLFGVTMSDHVPINVTDFWDHPRVTPHVAQRGVGLEGHMVTRITQTVDYITWTILGGNLVGNAQQSVRLYGQLVPEPSQFMAVATGFLFLIRIVRHQRD